MECWFLENTTQNNLVSLLLVIVKEDTTLPELVESAGTRGVFIFDSVNVVYHIDLWVLNHAFCIPEINPT